MGLTLRPEDFRQVAKTPKWILTGAVLQFTIMPFFGWLIGILLKLPTPFAVGLIIVSCCPGGTASNVIAFLARANVALSVAMTAVSTLLAIALTPMLTSFLIGDRVPVDAWQLFWGTAKVVLLPILLGVSLNWFFPKLTKRIIPYSPPVAVIAIVLIVASIIGQGKKEILESGMMLLAAVFLLHGAGFLLGYFFTKVIIKNETVRRTVCIEVGMQNSGLGAYLARANFANPATAIPSALSSAMHCILGSIIAGIFRKAGNKNDVDS